MHETILDPGSEKKNSQKEYYCDNLKNSNVGYRLNSIVAS